MFSDNQKVGEIGKGLVVLLGIKKGDTDKDIEYVASKLLNLRIFEDENDKMNLSLKDVQGELAIVSQFTLYGDCRHGRRPGFSEAELPDKAEVLYESFVEFCRTQGVTVATGRFQTHMKVELENDGPVTILLDSEKLF
ncbi:D-tyrosyl-tRNA(Tyr) deacylase [Veillonellaceae bacterium DNF00626]|nr:D-tyrosyl-tRNA(Tyr) deacylase [Veillonellaceae bacterium DNF00626]